ncbi:MAG: PKD domain-containing protein, partial [Bacteroidota bacterium]
YRSTDGGSTFTQLYAQKCFDIKLNLANSSIVYLVKDNPTLKICEFYTSINSGATWTQQTTGWYTSTDTARNDGGARIGVTPADPNRVYAYLIGEAKVNDYGYIGVYKSTDGGSSWTLPNGPAGGPYTATHPNLAYGTTSWTYHQGFYNCAIMVSATDPNKILIGGLNMWRSNDAGATFEPVAGYVSGGNLSIHVDMQDFRAIGNNYWVTTDGGIYTSPDFFATTTTHKTSGIRGSEYWGFGSGWNQDVLVGGLYHNGNIAYYENYGEGNFLSLGGGEASTGYVNPGNNMKTYFSDIGGKYLPENIVDAVVSFGLGMSPNESYYPGESSEITFLPSCYNIGFLGKDNKLWKTTDGGASFSLLKTFGTNTNNQVKYIQISRSNSQVMYVNQQPQSGSTGTLWKTIDGGTTWTSVTIPAGNSRVMLLALDYTNPNVLWISYTYGANGSRIFKTINGGSTWTNLSTAMLNGEDAHSLAAIPNTNGGIYYCSGRTVFYRNNTLTDWQLFNDSLPAYFNSDIAHPFFRDGKLRIASYGKGIWESPLYEQPSSPVAQIMVDKLQQTVVCVADSFYFDDYSVLNHSGASWQWTFQGGNPSTSNLRNPHVYFSSPGTYLATLTVTDGIGHSASDSLYVNVSAFVPPLLVQEGFQASFPPSEIMIVNPENDAQWSLNSAAGGFGGSSQCAIFDNFDNDSHGNWDDMRVSVNFANPTTTNLVFDVAHACYGGQYTDTLEVLVSADCGLTFTQVYKKWGNTLATAPNNSNYYTPTASEWRKDTVHLSAFAGTAHLLVAFRNIGLWGNNIYIDNINLPSYTTSVNETKAVTMEVFPNPVDHNGFLTITNPLNEEVIITLFDGKGSRMFKNKIAASTNLDLSQYNLSAGIYHLNLQGETRIMNYKLLIE